MRPLLTGLYLTLAVGYGSAQKLMPNPGFDAAWEEMNSITSRSTTMVCTDTLTYPYQKNIGGSFPGILLDAGTSATALAQRYEPPAPVIVSGFDFYAYEAETGVTAVVPLTCNLYRADVNGLPMGTPLASVIVNVDDTYGSLSVMRKKAIFPSPVTLDFPFLLSVESSSTTSVAIYTNNYANHSGRYENLSAGQFGFWWYNGLDIMVGADSFDADVLLYPYVEYEVVADFAKDKSCIDHNETVTFTNLSSVIYESRFFNKYAYGFPVPNPGVESYDWDYGDGTTAPNTVEGSHTYGPKGKYLITLTNKIDGWKRDCIATVRDSIDQVPYADFTFTGTSPVFFQDASVGSDQTLWDFGDGTTTTVNDPIYAWSSPGTYTVTLIVRNACGADTVSKTVTVYGVGTQDPSVSDIQITPNPVNDLCTITSPQRRPGVLTIVDALGQQVLSTHLGGDAVIHVSHWKPGVYIARFESGDASSRTMILKR